MGPTSSSREVAEAREAARARGWSGEIPEGVRVHLKLDTGMGRWGLGELPEPPAEVVGLMCTWPRPTPTPPSRGAGRALPRGDRAVCRLMRHVANSAAALRLPAARFDAVRCGVALYGLSPFGEDPAADGLEPALSWRSYVAQVSGCSRARAPATAGGSSPNAPTWIGIVPVGYADGFRRDLTGTEVLVGGELRRVVGTVSMDAFAVELYGEEPVGAPVTFLAPACWRTTTRAWPGRSTTTRLRDELGSTPRAADGGRCLRAPRR